MKKVTFRLKTPKLEKDYQNLEIKLIKQNKTAQQWFENALENSKLP